jgi:uncharacterized SAM-binding protein YcdF (DUF218 family)
MSAATETLAGARPATIMATESVVQRPRKFIRVIRWLSLFALLLVLAWIFRAQLLKQFAEMWIVDERLQRADAIVVLGGGASSRPGEAARLYHQGYASQLLVMVSGAKPSGEDQVQPVAADKQALLGHGVPETAVVTLGGRVTSTYDEAKAVYAWAATSGVKRIIIPSDMFHTRRMHWIFQKTLRPLHIDVTVTSIPSKAYSTSNWWKSEEGFLTLNNEVIKLIYYRWNY